MEKKDTDLLLKDLCARLPYEVKVLCLRDFTHKWYNLERVDIRANEVYVTTPESHSYADKYVEIEAVRPYLFPLSSMTERQCYELASIRSGFQDCWKYIKTPIPLSICNFEQIEWFHKNHLDYRGLIPMGLAIDATGLNIY